MVTPGADDQTAAIRFRRRMLFAFGVLALVAVVGVAAVQTRGDDERPPAGAAVGGSAAVVVERIELKAKKTGKTRGLVEVVVRDQKTSLRMIAVKLEPTRGEEIYQVTLIGGREDEKVLGGRPVGESGTFLARAEVTSAELHRHRGIELRRVAPGDEKGELVLDAKIPR